MAANIITVVNQKGGTGKTASTVNLSAGLAREGKSVLAVDLDAQGSLTISFGQSKPDDIPVTVSTILEKYICDIPIGVREGIIRHREGVDFIPANIELSGTEVGLVNVMNRERILRGYLNDIKQNYDHILIDCQPSLGMLTINALAAADSVIIPVQPEYLSAKGLEQLMHTISKVRRNINPELTIAGILLTMVDNRTNYAKEVCSLIRDTYGESVTVFGTEIPRSIRIAESSALGKSIFKHDPMGKAAKAYRKLTKEILLNEKRREGDKAAVAE